MSTGGAGSAFGDRLRRLRESAGLTQEELAERAGLTAKGISALERGERRRPYPQTVRSLSAALRLSDADHAALVATVPSRSDPSVPGAAGTDDGTWPEPRLLPGEPTPLLGRSEESAIIRDQLVAPDVRLLTLVGAGGVGKTRLAVAAARGLADERDVFDGVWFVDLSAVREPSLVLATVARAIRASIGGAADPAAALTAFIGDRSALLVLDNFEQVLAAANDVGGLLTRVPGLTLLVTSRQPLRLRWERTMPVHPLALPDPRHLPPLDELAAVPAVALFLDRARTSAPTFALTEANAPAVAELCVRLDGLPLAIELVAARAAQLGPAATLDRLARRLPFPAPFMQDAPERHQSLRATLRWSLDLLGSDEVALFGRLSVFAGGWSTPAAQAVAGGDDDVLASLASLADACLIVRDPRTDADEARFRMLETAREVAEELLEADDDGDAVHARHAAFYADLAEATAAQLQGTTQAGAVGTLEREEDNIGQVLRWAMATRAPAAVEAALRIAGALGWYWFLHGYPAEARDWFEVLLRPDPAAALPGSPDEPGDRARLLRARALNAAGFRATDHAEYVAAATFHREALVTWREMHHVPGLVASLHGVGDTALWVGDSGLARESYEEGLALARTEGTPEDVALFAFHLAQWGWLQGALDDAERFGDEALAVGREAGSTTWPPYALFVLASIAHERGDARRAGGLYREAIGTAWEHRDRLCVRMALPGLAALATLEGDPARALRLAGAANALEQNAGIWAFPPIRERHERWLAAAQRALDADTRAAAWAEGRSLAIDDVIAYALEEPVASTPSGQGPLSPREREVLALVADGRSNREIADVLFVTEHTAKYHVTQLFNKLGASSRAEAVARAVALGLLTPSRD